MQTEHEPVCMNKKEKKTSHIQAKKSDQNLALTRNLPTLEYRLIENISVPQFCYTKKDKKLPNAWRVRE